MESDTISMNISYSDILKSIGLSYISNGSFYHFAIPCIDYLESIASVSYAVLPNVDLFTLQLQYITFINTTLETSLVAQWLGIRLPVQGTWV